MSKRSLAQQVQALERIVAALEAGRPAAPEDAQWFAGALRKFRTAPAQFDTCLGLVGAWRHRAALEDRDSRLRTAAAVLPGSNCQKAIRLHASWFQLFGLSVPRLSPDRIRAVIADCEKPSQ